MFTHILIPTDFSPATWKAVEMALNLSDHYNCEISILHIYPATLQSSDGRGGKDLIPKLKNVEEHMIKLSDDLKADRKTKINNLVVSGNIEKQLMKFANQHAYDLVIIGVNSTGDDNSPGSHTTKLIEQSSTPVLVIPNNYSLDV